MAVKLIKHLINLRQIVRDQMINIAYLVFSKKQLTSMKLKNNIPAIILILNCVTPFCSSLSQTNDCTVITVEKRKKVFFGGNDDYIKPDTYYWVDRGGENNYGAFWIGQPDNVQQGVNSKGLAYDANGLPRIDVNPHNEREQVNGEYNSYPIKILRECESVQEVIDWANSHRWHTFMHDQMHFADASGDAVIISAGTDEELVFTRKEPGDGFLVSTNFNVSQPASNSYSYPCWRYDLASEMLEELISGDGDLDVEDVEAVMEAVHVEDVNGWTRNTFLADLTGGRLYLYYFYQFDKPIVIDIKEEISNPREPGPFNELFPDDVRDEAGLRYENLQKRSVLCMTIGLVWLVLVASSLIILILAYNNRLSKHSLWLFIVFIMGPVGLIILIYTNLEKGKKRFGNILVETTGDIMPAVASFVLILYVFVRWLAPSGNFAVQIIMIIVLPALISWLIFNLILKLSIKEGSPGFFANRFVHSLITSNLGAGGISLMLMPLADKSLEICSVNPMNSWPVILWWGIAVLGAIFGGALVFIHNSIAYERGLKAWGVASGNREGPLEAGNTGKTWQWILISYLVLIAGVALGAMIRF